MNRVSNYSTINSLKVEIGIPTFGEGRPVLWSGDVLAALFNKIFFVAVCYNLPRSIRGSPVVIGALDLTTSEDQVLHSH